MQKRKKILAGVLAGTLALSACPFALAASYNDSSVTGGSEEWQAWVSEWESVATDYTKVSLTPGADETQLNFAWYSKSEDGKTATPVVHFGTDKDNLTAFTGTSGQVDTSLTDGVAYDYNHVVVTGLEPNTTYYYTVEKNGVQTEVQEYKTGSFESVKILYVGDPQIGASKGQTQGSDTLKADSGAANTAARNDAFAWNRTLEIASAQNPDLNFVISAGDQVNKTGQAKEEEYAGYLSASVLSGLPVATTIGNHDSLNPDYTYHFNNPNTTGYGKTEAGGDYYYSYGSGLFIVLNTNNYNVAEHEKTIQEAVASDPDAAWRVVTIHQDIYGTGLDHSDTDGMILRTQLTPIFDEYDIDVVLQGHDHTYSRSKLLYGDGQTHGTYEFRLNEDGSDYDWDNAYNTQTDEKIPLYPEEGDTAGTAAHDAFQADNGCYTIEDTTGNTVVNPKGTLYMTANSASGSKFYELIAAQQDYIAARSQNWLPSYSVIEMDEDSFSIITYQVTAEGKTEAIDDAFTIQKSAADQDEQANVATLTAGGETYYRLRDVAASVNGSDSQFNVAWNDGVVVTTGAAYTDAVPAAVPTAAAAASLTLAVDGESVTTDAMLADGNYYVTASFLATLGVSLGA
ncbi:fibronectin type III domain-containing protein [Intestinimonas timonensis]|uniref:fibronectin type III domain-containing protein n=1 Tax=Intestinimonas timonensis TaxID=1689270 RepID=UPI003A91483D